jgi:hypothetical protein
VGPQARESGHVELTLEEVSNRDADQSKEDSSLTASKLSSVTGVEA